MRPLLVINCHTGEEVQPPFDWADVDADDDRVAAFLEAQGLSADQIRQVTAS